jgi:hypothetical protein
MPAPKIDLSLVKPTRGMFAPVSNPDKHGKRWIDYSAVRFNARESRKEAGKYWPGGWGDLRKRGWRIIRVDVIASVK